MEVVHIALLSSLYVMLVQALVKCSPSFESADRLVSGLIDADIAAASDGLHLALTSAALHEYRLCCGLLCAFDDLRFWVKPRSTTWFDEFLMNEYDDSRWISMFRMSKSDVARLCHTLRPAIQKQCTKYRQSIPVEIRVCCALFKLAQGANLLQCSELFAIGRASVGRVLREVVRGICCSYKNLIRWPIGHHVREVMDDFQEWCGMPSVHGAIDATHIQISKPKLFPEDYYYYKTSSYTVVLQAVVDCKKRFTNIFVGLPGSVNDMRALRRSGLYRWAQSRSLMHMTPINHVENIPPYLLGDKGYPLLSWILTPHKDDGQERTILELLYNKKHRRGRSVVENTFGLLKQTWREMGGKTNLDVKFVPDVVVACCILHNLVMGAEDVQVRELMQVLAAEAEVNNPTRVRPRAEFEDVQVRPLLAADEYNMRLENGEVSGSENRRIVQAYLGTQRRRAT